MLATGPANPVGVLIGESPGRDEAEKGEPFVGNTGQELDKLLLDAGLLRGKLQLINAIACQPTKGRSDDDMRQAAKCCQPLFRKQLKKAPTLAMGKWAAFALTGKEYLIGDARGFIRKTKSRTWIATWHPTYAIWYNPWELANFEVDLLRFSRLLGGALRKGAGRIDTRVSATALRKFLLRCPAAAVDIETGAARADAPWTGKDPTRAVLKTIGFGWEEEGLSIHWASAPTSVRKLVKAALADPKRLKVLHNGWFFDIRVLERYGLCVR